MTTYTATRKAKTGGASYGDAVALHGKVTVAANENFDADNSDLIKLIFVPAGTEMMMLDIVNGDLDSGTNLTAKIGYMYDDGTAGDDDAFMAAGAWGQAAATSKYVLPAPITVEKDAWITITPTNTTAAANAGAVDVYGVLTGVQRGVA